MENYVFSKILLCFVATFEENLLLLRGPSPYRRSWCPYVAVGPKLRLAFEQTRLTMADLRLTRVGKKERKWVIGSQSDFLKGENVEMTHTALHAPISMIKVQLPSLVEKGGIR